MKAARKTWVRPVACARQVLAFQFTYTWSELRGDVLGGLAASVLAIPLALALGELSGLGPAAGLYGALALGVIGAIGGNTLGMVSGPSSPIAVMMALVVAKYAHSIEEALLVAVLAGLVQAVLGLMRFGRYISYIPVSLLEGFLIGIGVLLIVSQISPALGVTGMNSDFMGSLRALPSVVAHANLHATVIAACCLAVLALWRGRLRRYAPGYLVLVVAGPLAGAFLFTEAPVVGQLSAGLPAVRWPEFSGEVLLRIAEPTFMIALISALDVLTLSVVVDSITRRRQQPNRLLTAHGAGNVAAGLVGGLPGSVSAATFVNVHSGGRTLVSNLVVAAVVLLVLVTDLGVVIEVMPKAVLASILIALGVRLINWRLIRRLRRVPRAFWLTVALTALLAILVDVLTGLVIGFVVGTLVNSRRTGAFEVDKLISVPLLDSVILGDRPVPHDPFGARGGLIRFPDRISVASAQSIAHVVERDIRVPRLFVLFDLAQTEYIDETAAVMLGSLINTSTADGPVVLVSGMRASVFRTMDSMGLLDAVPPGRIVPDLEAAKAAVRPLLEADIASGA